MNKYEKCVMAVKNKQLKSCEKRKWKGSRCINPWAVCTKTVGRPKVRGRSSSGNTKRKSTYRRRSRSKRISRKPSVRRFRRSKRT